MEFDFHMICKYEHVCHQLYQYNSIWINKWLLDCNYLTTFIKQFRLTLTIKKKHTSYLEMRHVSWIHCNFSLSVCKFRIVRFMTFTTNKHTTLRTSFMHLLIVSLECWNLLCTFLFEALNPIVYRNIVIFSRTLFFL
jgi:hypothetical protein